MDDTVIRIERLGKRYVIGGRAEDSRLRERLHDVLAAPWRRLRGLPVAAPPERQTIWALRDVTLTIGAGEVCGVIGRNGAGKSTLLKILTRITLPSEGFAEIRGRVTSLLEVGTGFHPEFSGRENIFMSGALLGMSREEIRRKFDAIVDFSELGRFIDTPVKRYSSGMRVRLGFAVASHLDAEILLVDEVLSVGDAAFQRKCMRRVDEMAKGGLAVLLVSHNMAAVRRLCTSAIWLDRGRLAAAGDVEEVTNAYEQYRGSANLDSDTSDVAPAAVAAPDAAADGGDIPTAVHVSPSRPSVELQGPTTGEGPASAERTLRAAALREARLISASGARNALASGEAARFVLDIEVREPVDRLRVIVTLSTTQGVPVWSASTRQRLGLLRLGRGRHQATFEVPAIPLRPGPYDLSAQLAISGRGMIDRLAPPLEITVTPDPAAQVVGRRSGLLMIDSTVEVNSQSGAAAPDGG